MLALGAKYVSRSVALYSMPDQFRWRWLSPEQSLAAEYNCNDNHDPAEGKSYPIDVLLHVLRWNDKAAMNVHG